MRTETITIYKFDELSAEAQKHALDNSRSWNVDDSFWYECVFEDAKRVAEIFGIEIKDIFFSGFWSQGDGACFTGHYEYRPGWKKALKEYAPQDKELLKIGDWLQCAQRSALYSATASIKHEGRYHHSGCMDIDMYVGKGDACGNEIGSALRQFADWIYRRLESDYEYLTSDEQVRESLLSNDVEFYADGCMYR